MDKNTKVIFDKLKDTDYKFEKIVSLNGTQIDTKEDLVNLCNVYRNPKFETFRIFYIKDSKIVGQEAFTNRIPNTVYLFKKSNKAKVNYSKEYEKIRSRIRRLNAKGYYLVHNHSSPKATPSLQDLIVTQKISENVDGFLGHVVLGCSDKYSFITKEDALDFNFPKEERIDTAELKVMETKLIKTDYKDIAITSRDKLIAVLKTISNSKEYSTAILTSADSRVRMILDIPNRMFNQSKDELRGYFRNIAREHGATRVFIGTESEEVYKKSHEHLEYGTLKDVIYFDDLSMESYKGIESMSDYDLFDNTLYDRLKNLNESEEKYMREDKITVLYKKVGKDPIEIEIENTLEAKQQLVGGLIEVVPYYDVLLVCNEEGKLMNYLPNVVFEYDYIAGDFFIIGDDYENGDFKSLTKEEIEKYKKDLKERSFTYVYKDSKDKNIQEKDKENIEIE